MSDARENRVSPVAPGETADSPGRAWLAFGATAAALVRPRIVALMLVSMAAGALCAVDRAPEFASLLHALAGAALVIAGAAALNQSFELSGDAKMARTAARPLPSGRIGRTQAAALGGAISTVGLIYLFVCGGWLLAALAAASWLVYVVAYTPLKSRTAWQTPVGAIAGAMPVLLGAAAVGHVDSPTAWGLFAVLWAWQLPHSMAIAWLYRNEFAAAGIKVAAVVDPRGRWAGGVATMGAAALLPLGAWLAWPGGAWFLSSAIALSAALAAFAVAFARQRTDRHARWLLRASVFYLPAMLAVIVAAHFN